MSLFRKPTKRIQRRVFTADDDAEDGEPEPPPPPVISRKETKPAKIKMKSLLSFADEEEEDGEVFQVKKSSQSKKLKKKREKEKLRGPDGDSNKYDNNSIEVNDGANQTDKPKKKVTLEGLILSGREALSAEGAGDVSDEGSQGSEDSRGFHQYRPERVRAALAVAPGHIPDAALIHAARKTRQQARELGDFAPIGNTEDNTDSKRSRLVREDGSGDDDEEGRIQVVGLQLPSDKPKRGTCAAPSNEELESDEGETATWEDQQMQKAMLAINDRAAGESEMSPLSVCPPPPRMQDAPPHLRPLAPGLPPPATPAHMMLLLTERLNALKAQRQVTASKTLDIRERLFNASRTRENRAARTAELDATYRRAQAIRGYLTDLVECLDEKMPQLEALEAKALALHKRRYEFLVERRRADVRDQAQEVLSGGRRGAAEGTAAGGAAGGAVRRAAEREGRRRARRLRREAAGAALHQDGDSSDDDLPPDLAASLARHTEEVSAAAAALFADALPAWRSVRGVCCRLASFRRRQPAAYRDAYLPDCLPRILAPYIRHQLILWNPLADENNEDWEKMDWYKCLMMYGVHHDKMADSDDSDESDDVDGYPVDISEEAVREDPDLMLVPTIIDKVVLPKVTELVCASWDPVCVRSTVRLRGVLLRALSAARRPLAALDAAAAARLHHALQHDVFLPTLPPHLAEGAGGAFWRRCLGGGVRLLRSLLALTAPPRALHGDAPVLRLLATLCAGAGAAGGAAAAGAAAALRAPLPRGPALRRPALRLLARLAAAAAARLADHPLHLKAIEQARSIIAEAELLNEEQS